MKELYQGKYVSIYL